MKRPWQDRQAGAHPRGSVRSQQDTDRPGHYVIGRGGVREWVEDGSSYPKRPGAFLTAIGPDGRPIVPFGPGAYTGMGVVPPAHITDNLPAPNPNLYEVAAVPLPPGRPFAPTPAPVEVAPTLPLKPDTARYPVVPDPVGSAGPTNTDGNALMRNITPTVDPASATDALFQLGSLSEETGAKMQASLNVTATPVVDTGSIHAAQAAAEQLLATLARIGAAASAASSAVAAAGGANATINPGQGRFRSFNAVQAGNIRV